MRGKVMSKGMTSSDSPEWYTPKKVIDLVCQIAPIALDPCWSPDSHVRPLVGYTETDDGLAQTWDVPGLLFMNPPYGDTIGQWVRRCANRDWYRPLEHTIALLPARTDTVWFQRLWSAPAILFVKGRLPFVDGDGEGHEVTGAPFPSVIVYWGADVSKFSKVFKDMGAIVVRSPHSVL